MSVLPSAPFLLLTHLHTLLPDWNENVVPRLLVIFQSVEWKAKGQRHTRNVEMRQQEFAERSAPLIGRYRSFLDGATMKRAPQVQKLLPKGDYKIPTTPEGSLPFATASSSGAIESLPQPAPW